MLKQNFSSKKTRPYLNIATFKDFDNSLNEYLKAISNYKILPPTEEKELAKLAQKGDLNAKRELVKANLKLVVNIARKNIINSNLPMIDLIQEGNLGLMLAVEKFNWHYGYKFSTYAAWWIRQAMFKAISEQSFCVKIPVYIQETLSKFSKVKFQMEQVNQCHVTNSEVAKKMNISENKIDNYLNAYTQSLSIDANYEHNNGSDIKIADILEDEHAQSYFVFLENEELKNDLAYVLSKLKEKEKQVIKLRFGIDNLKRKTLEDVGKIYGVTKECIRQTEKRALQKMYNFAQKESLLSAYIQ